MARVVCLAAAWSRLHREGQPRRRGQQRTTLLMDPPRQVDVLPVEEIVRVKPPDLVPQPSSDTRKHAPESQVQTRGDCPPAPVVAYGWLAWCRCRSEGRSSPTTRCCRPVARYVARRGRGGFSSPARPIGSATRRSSEASGLRKTAHRPRLDGVAAPRLHPIPKPTLVVRRSATASSRTCQFGNRVTFRSARKTVNHHHENPGLGRIREVGASNSWDP